MKDKMLNLALKSVDKLANKDGKRVICMDEEMSALLFTPNGMTPVMPVVQTEDSATSAFYMMRAIKAMTDDDISAMVDSKIEAENDLPETDYHFRYIALCGFPKVGKTEIQKILQEEFGVIPIDDGAMLRNGAKAMFGLSSDQVLTQEGKNSEVTICEKDYKVRKVLGDLGNLLESHFGDQIVPETAIADAERLAAGRDITFSFGSVRKNQGQTYQKNGKGVVVEIVRPGVEWSGNDFDLYDEKLVDCTFVNDAGDLNELRFKVVKAFAGILGAEVSDA